MRGGEGQATRPDPPAAGSESIAAVPIPALVRPVRISSTQIFRVVAVGFDLHKRSGLL